MKLLELARKLIYAQVLIGVLAYSVAASDLTLLMFGVTFGVLSWILVEGPNGRPLPRWLINFGVLAVMLWLIYTHFALNRPLILGLGQFILFIQLFKLYEKKSNRDWGELIVLSLMLMICASIISADVVFGVLLAVYLVVMLLAVLMFQLKMGRDEVEAVQRAQAPEAAPLITTGAPVTRRFRRHFNLLATWAGTMALVLSAVFFVLIPRGQGAGLFGEYRKHAQQSVSGYDDEVSLSGGGRMSTSRLPVMNVAFSRDGRSVGSGGQAFLLRGAALDRYDPDAKTWVRSKAMQRRDHTIRRNRNTHTNLASRFDDSYVLTQYITLRAQPRDALFAAFSPVSVDIEETIHFNPMDQVLSTHDADEESIQYVVESVQAADGSLAESYRRRWQSGRGHDDRRRRYRRRLDWEDYARDPVTTTPRVAEFTRGILEQNDLTRDPEVETTEDDQHIADILSRHLQTRLEYSLNVPPVDQHPDPIDAFLFEYQRGHCEFFASAMCAMLRSVGIRSRVVTGFRATEYNAVGEYYVVRARNAHAWVEVWLGEEKGWRTYDPSPPTDVADHHQGEGGLFAALRDLYDYVEFQWINRIISYDSTQQRTVMTHLSDRFEGLRELAESIATRIREVAQRFHENWMRGLGGYVLLLGFAAAAGTAGYLLMGSFSRQREFLRRLRLDAVGRREQRRLARQLEFYVEAMRLAEQCGGRRPDWQTPKDFARQLATESPERFAPLVPLTELFYEIRFGGRELDAARQTAVAEHLTDLRARLNGHRPANAA